VKRLLALVALAGCASRPDPDYESARLTLPSGRAAESIRADFGVAVYGAWEEGELAAVRAALEAYSNKDLSGLEFYRFARGAHRGARYDGGRVSVWEPTRDVLIHELGHAVHSRAVESRRLSAELQAFLPFSMFHRTAFWEDGSEDPRSGFVTPYAAMNVEECVAESVAAAKLWSRERRGPLGRVDWGDPKFARVYELLDRHGLIDDADRAAIRVLMKR
jgi:hypothetical protein